MVQSHANTAPLTRQPHEHAVSLWGGAMRRRASFARLRRQEWQRGRQECPRHAERPYFNGTVNSNRTPRPAAAATVMLPPICAARSFILRRPFP